MDVQATAASGARGGRDALEDTGRDTRDVGGERAACGVGRGLGVYTSERGGSDEGGKRELHRVVGVILCV